MRKIFLILLSIILLGLSATISSAQKPIVLKWAHVYAPDHPHTLASLRVAELVAKRTNNQLLLQIFPASQLGTEKDIVEGLVMGTLPMASAGLGEIGKWHPPFLIGESPYLFRDVDHLYRVIRGPVGQEMVEDFVAKRGVRVFDVWYYGTRHVTTSNRPVYRPEDLKGLKLRVADMPMSLEYGKAMGASPTPMAFAEVYLALQQGVVEGQENPIATIAAMKFYEVQKYLMLTGHLVQGVYVMVSEKVYRGLPPDFQKILRDTIIECTDYQNKLIMEMERTWLEKFKEKGMIIISPKEGLDVEAFRRACAYIPTKPEFEAKWGKGLAEKIWAVK